MGGPALTPFRGLAAAGLLALAAASVLSTQTRSGAHAQFDAQRAWEDLTKQVDFGPRVPGTEAQAKCRDWMIETLKKSCDKVETQKFTHVWSKTHQELPMWNVIGYQNWDKAQVRVAIIAHWDSRAEADQETDPVRKEKPIPGANDGASGVAVITELARVMKSAKVPIGIQYVLTDGEDLGPGEDEMYLGAIVYAEKLGSPRANYGILLDMIGKKNVRIPMEDNSLRIDGNLEYALYRMAARLGLSSAFPMEDKYQIDDDHLPITKAGLKTIDLIDFDYSPYWHTLNDTVDKCSPDSLGKVGKLMQAWLEQNPPYRD